MKWLDFERKLETEAVRVFGQLADLFHGPLPLVGRRNDFLLPDVLAEHQQQIPSLEFVAQVKIRLCTRDVEVPHGTIEIGDAESTADRGYYRQARSDTSFPDKAAYLRTD